MIPAPEAAEKALRMVREAPLISYDTETSGLDWKRNYPVGYVIGVEDECVYVPVRHGGGGNLSDSGVRVPDGPVGGFKPSFFEEELATAFSVRPGKTVGHHIKFDCHFSANAGIMLGRNLADTQIYAAMIDEYAKGYSLEACAERFKATAKKVQTYISTLLISLVAQLVRSK